jgi:hypothetical protein
MWRGKDGATNCLNVLPVIVRGCYSAGVGVPKAGKERID